MTEMVAKSTGATGTGRDVYTLHTGKVMAFLGLVSFASLFCTLPSRKLMILDYKLMYPSGSAIAGIVNSFHTPAGAATAKLQVLAMTKAMVGSFKWASFQWIYTGGSGCGFQDFPMFGLRAYKQKFYFDFSASLVGVGMICPVVLNFSMLFGSAITSFFLWPALQRKKGQWYTDPSPTNFRGINGYKVFKGIYLERENKMLVGRGGGHGGSSPPCGRRRKRGRARWVQSSLRSSSPMMKAPMSLRLSASVMSSTATVS